MAKENSTVISFAKQCSQCVLLKRTKCLNLPISVNSLNEYPGYVYKVEKNMCMYYTNCAYVCTAHCTQSTQPLTF